MEPAAVCAISGEHKKKGYKAVLMHNVSKIPVATIVGRLDTMMHFLHSAKADNKKHESINLDDILQADQVCKKKQPAAQCPTHFDMRSSRGVGEFVFSQIFLLVMPTTCEHLFGFCDEKDDKLRQPCPESACCNVCNMVGDANACDGNTFAEEVERQLLGNGWSALSSEFETLLTLIQFEAALRTSFLETLEWYVNTIASVVTENGTKASYSWEACMSQCKTREAAKVAWFGNHPECLPRINRSWTKQKNNDTTINSANGTVLIPETCRSINGTGATSCDERARIWSQSVLVLHGLACFGATVLIGVQLWIAIVWDNESTIITPTTIAAKVAVCIKNDERHRRCLRSKEQFLSATVTLFLIVCLVRQLDVIASASNGISCHGIDASRTADASVRASLSEEAALQNRHLLFSWALLTVVMMAVFVLVLLMPAVYWLLRGDYAKAEATKEGSAARVHAGSMNDTTINRTPNTRDDDADDDADGGNSIMNTGDYCCSRLQRCVAKFGDAKLAFDDLFSFERALLHPPAYRVGDHRSGESDKPARFLCRPETVRVDYDAVCPLDTQRVVHACALCPGQIVAKMPKRHETDFGGHRRNV